MCVRAAARVCCAPQPAPDAENLSKNAIKRLKKAEFIAAKKREKQLASAASQSRAADEGPGKEFTWSDWEEEVSFPKSGRPPCRERAPHPPRMRTRLQGGGVALTFLGHDLRGIDKYLGGELGADGNIYGAAAVSIPPPHTPSPACTQ